MHNDIGTPDFGPGAFDAEGFDAILSLPKPRRVGYRHRHALQEDLLRDFVARGSGDIRHDGDVFARKRIEQAGLADVGLPRQNHMQAFAQDKALPGLLENVTEIGLQAGKAIACPVFFEKLDFFLGEIQRCLDEHAQLDDSVGQRMNAARKLPAHRRRGRARRRLGGCVNQIGDRFRLRQIDFVVQERTQGEFPRLREPQAAIPAKIQAAPQQLPQNGRTTVPL